jgi:hypothetical protein
LSDYFLAYAYGKSVNRGQGKSGSGVNRGR